MNVWFESPVAVGHVPGSRRLHTVGGYWPWWPTGTTSGPPDWDIVRAMARKVRTDWGITDQPLCLDLETLILGEGCKDPKQGDAGFASFCATSWRIIDIYRAEMPAAKMCIYGYMPEDAYYVAERWPRDRSAESAHAHSAWLGHNRAFRVGDRPLADAADIICPSIYPFSRDIGAEVRRIRQAVAEAKKYGKPIIPWCWANLHQSIDTSTPYLGDAYVQRVMTVLRSLGITDMCWLWLVNTTTPDSFWSIMRAWQTAASQEDDGA